MMPECDSIPTTRRSSVYQDQSFKRVRDSLTLAQLFEKKKGNNFGQFISFLVHKSRDQRVQLIQSFDEASDIDLAASVSKAFGKSVLGITKSLVCTEVKAYLTLLYEAIKTKKPGLVVLLLLDPLIMDIDVLHQSYKLTFGKELSDDISRSFSAEQKTICLNLVRRDDDDISDIGTDPGEIAETLATKVLKKDTDYLITVLSRMKPCTFCEVLQSVEECAEKSLFDLYKDKLKQPMLQILQIFCDICKSPAYAYAHYLAEYSEQTSLELSLIMLRSEIDLQDIMQMYQKFKGSSLLEDLMKSYKDYERTAIKELFRPFEQLDGDSIESPQ